MKGTILDTRTKGILFCFGSPVEPKNSNEVLVRSFTKCAGVAGTNTETFLVFWGECGAHS